MTSKYIPAQFEKKWIEKWEEEKVYQTKNMPAEDKVYTLVMFPYPSGEGLHTGHARVYTGTDVLARFFRMKGQSVLHPMGWDAFGLPAENAAVKQKKNPMDMVPHNITNFKRQMKQLGLSYDWSREFATTDPDYYKWTQWLFIQFFKMGLLYKKETPIYYCSFCKTGLAQEEVLNDGTHERCGNTVEERNLPQWIFRITTYADRLLEDLDGLDWPKGILEMQKNWIGRKEGVEIKFKVQSEKLKVEDIAVFTTRLDTIQGVTFIVISPQKAKEWGLGEEEKDTGVKVINPVTDELVPVWIGEYVMEEVGTGIVMGVPEHDARDRAFAKKHGLPLKHIDLADGEKLAQDSVEKGIVKKVVTYHLRDWIFSRQRYWGEPIPMVFCQKCADSKKSWFTTREAKAHLSKYHSIHKADQTIQESAIGWYPLPENQLPLELPYVKSYEPTSTGESPLSQIPEFVHTVCPECGSKARRETDTMPNWAGSCWYFLYFCRDDNNLDSIAVPSLENWKLKIRNSGSQWLPVDWYIGGAEHAVLHLLYARFWVKAMCDLGLISFTEPFTKLRNVGMVIAADHRKMSKSLGNIITPDEVAEYGTDALRVYEMFMAPFSQEVVWSDSSMQGAYRFLKRIWHIYTDSANITEDDKEEDFNLSAELQSTITKVSSDITSVKFNTAISAMMEFVNRWQEPQEDIRSKQQVTKKLSQENAKAFLKILAPFAPFMTEELWHDRFHEKASIHLSQWPQAKVGQSRDMQITIPVQVNGKVRGVITTVNAELSEEAVLKKALEDGRIANSIEGKSYKIIYIEGKIMNIVISE